MGRNDPATETPLTAVYFIAFNWCWLLRVCLFYVLSWEMLTVWGSAQLKKVKPLLVSVAHWRIESTLSVTQCCHTWQPCPRISHFGMMAGLLEQNPNTVSLVHHHENQRVFPPLKAQSGDQWEKTHLASVLSHTVWVTLSWACPGGNSCQEPSNTQMLLPFCIYAFQTFPQSHLSTCLWYILSGTCSCRLHLNSNHIKDSCLSTSSTWHEISLYSSASPQNF